VTVIAFGAAAGSPGVTTTVAALAARWPDHREPLIVEADPSGGDLVARLAALDGTAVGLADSPSTVQLAARSRSGIAPQVLLEHLQRLPGPGEVRALIAPPGPFAAATAIGALATAGLAERLGALDGLDCLVDVGRIDATSPALPLVRAASMVVVVTRSSLESVRHTRELVTGLRSMHLRPVLLVVGDQPYAAQDVADAVEAKLLGAIPDDPTGARALAGDARSPKVLPRTRLLRAATEITPALATPREPTATSAAPTPERTPSPVPDSQMTGVRR